MILVLKKGSSEAITTNLQAHIEGLGLVAHVSRGEEQTVIGVVGLKAPNFYDELSLLNGVDHIIRIQKPYKIVSREFQKENSVVSIDGVPIGGKAIQMIAGPCTVESEAQMFQSAASVKQSGCLLMRGGAFKPRTSPYAFQGLGEDGLKLLRKAKQETGLKIVTELLDPRDTALVSSYADCIQIGARNMQNFRLLTEVGKQKKPVLLKRGFANSLQELLMAAEYIASQGNRDIILCERGIKTFETETRYTLDLSAVPVLRELTHLPIIVDPSHAMGKWKWVESMGKAALAAGADGLLLEIHPDPKKALCDGPQALPSENLHGFMNDCRKLAVALGRTLA